LAFRGVEQRIARARELFQIVVEYGPHEVGQRGLLVELLLNYSNWLADKGRQQEALQQLLSARRHVEHLLRQQPDDLEIQGKHVQLLWQTANCHHLLGEFGAALAASKQAVTEKDKLIAMRPERAESHDLAARICREMSDISHGLNQVADSIAALREAVKYEQTARDLAPNNVAFAQALIDLYSALARRHEELGQSDAAAEVEGQRASLVEELGQ
jgi:tetratricopeptide (TPR) repeat protein